MYNTYENNQSDGTCANHKQGWELAWPNYNRCLKRNEGEREMRKWIFIGLSTVVLLVGTFLVVNKVSPVGWGWWGNYNTSSGLALKGYDPVAYFNSKQPTQGTSDYSHEWGGVTWQFSSGKNRDLFSNSPDAYAPQYGGFCSFAVSKGFTADISPDAWHIENGKLYVFSDQNVRDSWVASLGEGSLKKSSTNWVKR